MTARIDLYFSFRSPYSYLATPGALQKAIYIGMDWERRAEMLGMPHKWPSPDPIVQDFETFTIAEEQPYIHRLVRLGVEAERRGKGIEYAAGVSRVIFGGTESWDQGDHLAQAAARAGLDLADMEAAIADPASHDAEIEDNQAKQAEAGHSGVPLFVYNGEPFFGQDRIDTLAWRLDKDGLARPLT